MNFTTEFVSVPEIVWILIVFAMLTISLIYIEVEKGDN